MHKIFKKSLLNCVTGLGSLLIASSSMADMTFKSPYNPIVTHMFTADPTARVINNRLYVYPSSDMECPEGKGSNGFCMPGYNVFSTSDLTHWTDHGNVINHTNVPWVEKESYGMWAPDTIEHKGKFYMFYPGTAKDGKHFREIGVAVADHPEGPFVARDSYIEGTDGIDPSPFIDDDGRVYLYWGGGENLNVVELNQEMTKIISKPQRLKGLPPKYKEGPFMFKRNGIYYFTFPHAPNGSEEIAYGIAKSPLGPIEYQGKILERWKDGQWTNHHSIAQYQDQWYIFYHHHDVSKQKNLRSMSVDRLYFDEDGKILFTPSTKRGIGYVSASDQVEVDRYTSLKNVQVSKNTSKGKPNWVLEKISKDGVATFGELDFADKQYTSVIAYVSSTKAGGKIHVHNQDGKQIATINVPKTGQNIYTAVSTKLNFSPAGMQTLKFTFSGNVSSLKFDWLRFTQADESLVALSGNTEAIAKIYGAATLTRENPSYINMNPFLRVADLHVTALRDDHMIEISVNGTKKDPTSIEQIAPGSLVNVSVIAPQTPPSAKDKIAATSFNKTHGVQTEEQGDEFGNIGYIENGDYVTYESIEFNKNLSLTTFEFAAASPNAGGQVEVRLGSATGELLARVNVEKTGGWRNWKTFSAKLNPTTAKKLAGEQEITLVFTGGKGYLFNATWFRFK